MGVPIQCLFLLAFVIHAGETGSPYDCRRVNSQCRLNVGVCSQSSGRCDCTAAIPRVDGFQGYDCNLETSSILTNCSITCYNLGTCYRNDMGQEDCYCTEEYTGPTCKQPRVEVTVCNETHIGMYIKPHHASIFNGLLAILQLTPFDSEFLLTDPECMRNGVFDKEADNSFSFLTRLDSSSPCFEALQITNFTDGGIRYEYTVRVNYAIFQTFVDETHSFVCEINPNGNFGGVRIGSERRNLNGVNVTASYNPALLRLLERSGSLPLGEAPPLVYLGEELFVQLSLKSDTKFVGMNLLKIWAKPGTNSGYAIIKLDLRYFEGYTMLTVDSCVAFSHLDGSGNTAEFFINRCPNPQLPSVVDTTVGAIRVSNTEVLVAFNVIRFINSADLFISCDVTLCTDSNTDLCEPANCTDFFGGFYSGFGRRKRDTEEVERLSLSHHAVVLSSKAELDRIRNCESRLVYHAKEERCSQNTLFIVVAAVSGVLLVVTLVVSIVLCRRYSSIHKISK